MLTKKSWVVKCLSALVVGLVLSGCASPARIERMTAAVSAYPSLGDLKGAVALADVTGGSDTNPLWKSQVSSEAFRRALENSLQLAGLQNPMLSGKKYYLKAELLRLEQPFAGFDMTVSASVRYSLVDKSTGKEIYTRVIPAAHTATMSDTLIGSERLMMANEGAIKANIQLLIQDLARVKL